LLQAGDLESYAELMHEHWQNKRRRSPGMATQRIDDLYTLARRSGVVGGKLVGAGGGGFLLLAGPPERHDVIRAALKGVREVSLRFTSRGTHIACSTARTGTRSRCSRRETGAAPPPRATWPRI
jgi:D-glycero-alpha-D-manno-heptose-7-phosphate kinase